MQRCNKCGVEYDGSVCPECGSELNQSENSESINEFLSSIHPNIYVRTTIKVLLLILFLGIVVFVVFFTDSVIEWIKGLF